MSDAEETPQFRPGEDIPCFDAKIEQLFKCFIAQLRKKSVVYFLRMPNGRCIETREHSPWPKQSEITFNLPSELPKKPMQKTEFGFYYNAGEFEC